MTPHPWLAPLLVALAGAPPPFDRRAPADESCTVCHGEEALRLARGVHGSAQLGCVTCHGGDPGVLEKAGAHGQDLASLDDRRDAVASCAACHSDPARMGGYGLRTDQELLYRASPHGARLFETGDDRVATCVDCHGAHDVFAARDPRSPTSPAHQPETCGRCHGQAERMEPYGLSSEAVAAYRESVHGRALLERGVPSSPSCTDCHGAHGTAPPGGGAIGRVCGTCHAVERAWLEEGPHGAAARAGTMGECLDCHRSHDVRPAGPALFTGQGAGHCGACHAEDKDPAAAAGRALRESLARFDQRLRAAQEALDAAAARGLFLEREDAFLADARSVRARAGPLVHTVSVARLEELFLRGEGMVTATYDGLARKERVQRDRKLFTAVFVAVTLLLVGVLQIYRVEVLRGRTQRTRGPRSKAGP